jgi:ATP-dependent Clp protease protease subunit
VAPGPSGLGAFSLPQRRFREIRTDGRVLQVRATAGESRVGELLLYGDFGSDDPISEMFGEITGKQVRADIEALGEVDEIRLYVNSMGGNPFTGQAIHSVLARHPANVVAYIDGICASAATLPVMAANRVVMPKGALMMIHKPWTFLAGNATEMRQTATVLDTVEEAMVATYQAKTGLDEARIKSLLNAHSTDGTWMTSEEAVEFGFADEIEAAKQVAAAIVRPGILAVNDQEFDVSRFKNVPEFPEAPRDAGQGKPTKRDAERALRDAGFSRDAVKSALAEGWREPVRDAPEAAEQRARARQRFETERLLARLARTGVPA